MGSIKLIILFLSVSLVATIGLFFYSETQLENYADVQPRYSPNSTDPIASNIVDDLLIPPDRSSKNKNASQSSSHSESQPDKALPIPAHQLKKVIADAPNTESLEQKIKNANASIEQLKEKMPENTIFESELNAELLPNEDTQLKTSNREIQKRLEHLQEYLQQ